MSRTEVVDKARDITAPILGTEKSEHLISIYEIETVTDICSPLAPPRGNKAYPEVPGLQ